MTVHEPHAAAPTPLATAGEAALARVLAALVQMPGPRDVMRAVLDAAADLTGAAAVYLLLRADGGLRLEAARDGGAAAPPTVLLPLDQGCTGQAVRTGVAVLVSDATADPDYRALAGPGPAAGVLAAVPLSLRGQVNGVLACARATGKHFTSAEVRWLQRLADILGVALENARLLEAERRSRSQAEVLSQLAGVESADLRSYCQRVVDTLAAALAVDHAHMLLLHAEGRGASSFSCSPGNPVPPLPASLLHDAAHPLGRAFQQREPLIIGDAAGDPAAQPFCAPWGLRSLAVTPIPREDGARGILLLAGPTPHQFGPQDTMFLQFLAERIGLTLHRAEVEREQARAEARQEFLAVVSHELRTPLAVIKAYTEVLERRTASHAWEQDDDRILATVSDQVVLMQGLVEQLLDLRRLDAGLMPLEFSRFDLTALAVRVAEVLQATTDRHRIVVAAPSPVLLVADRQRAHQVLSNLIENAVKYSPEGGEITVTVRAVPAADGRTDAALVTVTDQGRGLASEELEKAFDRFFQGQLPPFRGRRGLGLGLYIAREIVTRHGGAIWAHSEPGHGSTFAFTLPLAGPETEV